VQLAEFGDALNCPVGHAVHADELLVLNWPAGTTCSSSRPQR
jgi:hypothetical protein